MQPTSAIGRMSCGRAASLNIRTKASCATIRRMDTPLSDNTAEKRPPLDPPAVVGRFAPTPSGRMHLGNVFSLLMAWLGARSVGGRVILRVEDLDPRARDRATAEALMRDLEWLGLPWDEGPYYQSDRLDIYASAVERLSARGLTFPCFCTRAELHAATAPHLSDGTYVYQGTCRNLTPDQVERRRAEKDPSTRLRVPDADDPGRIVEFDDLVFGHQTEDLAHDCGDFVIRRGDGVFAYQLAVVVDDALMGVSQVVRGRDLLGSVARQMYLQDLLGYSTPVYAHVPLLVAADGRRLSKRDHDLNLSELRETGVGPRRIVGTLAAAAGLVPEGTEALPGDLLDSFSWEGIARRRKDIVAAPLWA